MPQQSQKFSHIHRIVELVEVRDWKVITNPFKDAMSREHAVVGFVNGKSTYLAIQQVTNLKSFKSDSTGIQQEYVLTGKPVKSSQPQNVLTPLADAWFCCELRAEAAKMFDDVEIEDSDIIEDPFAAAM